MKIKWQGARVVGEVYYFVTNWMDEPFQVVRYEWLGSRHESDLFKHGYAFTSEEEANDLARLLNQMVKQFNQTHKAKKI